MTSLFRVDLQSAAVTVPVARSDLEGFINMYTDTVSMSNAFAFRLNELHNV